jgi:hypothetical protein
MPSRQKQDKAGINDSNLPRYCVWSRLPSKNWTALTAAGGRNPVRGAYQEGPL